MKRIFLTIWAVFCAVGLLVLLVGAVGVFWILRSVAPTTDSSRYADIVLAHVGKSDRYTFLPQSIPGEANKVAFYYRPSLLQGYDIISLRVTLPPGAIETVLKELEGSGRTEIASFGDFTVPPHTFPQYASEKLRLRNPSELPDDFRIFLFQCKLEDMYTAAPDILSFTAVSTHRSEVVYYIIYD